MRTVVTSRVVKLVDAGAIVVAGLSATACRAPVAAVDIDAASIGGVVQNGTRPEAGVWVVAETTGLPTHFSRIVVTDDNGQFLIPDLPASVSYDVWVRGYGLRDSQPIKTGARRASHPAGGERADATGSVPNLSGQLLALPVSAAAFQCPSVGRLRGRSRAGVARRGTGRGSGGGSATIPGT